MKSKFDGLSFAEIRIIQSLLMAECEEFMRAVNCNHSKEFLFHAQKCKEILKPQNYSPQNYPPHGHFCKFVRVLRGERRILYLKRIESEYMADGKEIVRTEATW